MKHFFLPQHYAAAKADPSFNNPITHKLWNSFNLNCSQLQLTEGEQFTFVLGDMEPPALPDGKEYALLAWSPFPCLTN